LKLEKTAGGGLDVQFPVRALCAFDRVHLAPGETTLIKLHVAARQLQYWSAQDQRWETASGKRTVSVGGSSRNLPLDEDIE
jgi:beta-glucosidase